MDVRTVDPIDQIRMNFFDRVIAEEKERQAAEKRQQAVCVHRYQTTGWIIGEWEMRACETCGHEAIKRVRSWQRHSAGRCVIA